MRIEIATHTSRLLADNPLGDPVERELHLLLPPSYDGTRRFPLILLLAGYSSNGAQLILNRSPWQVPLARRLGDAMRAGTLPEAILAAPDCFTRYGGSQYVDSPAIGRYQSYLVDEIVPFVDAKLRTIAEPAGRGVVGKSSGGYGALTLAMERPGVFAAAASHGGDGAFELSYLGALGKTVLNLSRFGGIDSFVRWFEAQPAKNQLAFSTMEHLCCAAAWSPDDHGPYDFGRGFRFPLSLVTGALDEDVWRRWLARDPVRMLDDPLRQQALRPLAGLFVDGGSSDEYLLNLAARQLAAKLSRAGIAHTHEEYEGGHFGTPQRWDRAIGFVAAALANS